MTAQSREDAPNDAIAKIMKTLSDASKQRAAELSKLRHLVPDVSGKPTKESPIGDAISAVAKEFGKSEMLSRERYRGALIEYLGGKWPQSSGTKNANGAPPWPRRREDW